MSCLTVRGCILALILAALTLALIIVLATSFARVADDEICQLFYPDGGVLITQTEPALVFVGPGYEKYCVPKHVLHMTFDKSSGLEREIGSRTLEGLPVSITLDVEYRFTPAGLEGSMVRTGFKNYQERLLMSARAEVRNVCSRFAAVAFLRGSREAIAQQMRDAIAATIVERDGVLIEVVRVNLLTITVDSRFETKFQDVEDIRLLQLQALADLELARIEELRLNETEVISVLADRERRLQEARANLIAAQLNQRSSVTTADTNAQRRIIEAESTRITQLIRKQTDVDETTADRDLDLRQARRAALAAIELAETERLNMVTQMEGEVRRALSNRTRDIAQAVLLRTRRLESLEAVGINRTLELFRTELQANVTAQQIADEGVAQAEAAFVAVRADTDEHLALLTALNMTDTQLGSLLWHTGLGFASNITATLDYQKVALLNEFGGSSNVQVTSPAP